MDGGGLDRPKVANYQFANSLTTFAMAIGSTNFPFPPFVVNPMGLAKLGSRNSLMGGK